MDAGGVIGITIAVVVVVAWIISRFIYVVHQAEGIVLEKFGTFNRILSPGIHFVIPFIETPRKFSWKKTVVKDGLIVDEECTTSTIDMRESVFNFQSMRVFTNDTVELEVHAIMYFTIIDIKKAVYEVDDLAGAILGFAQTQLKDVFGGMTFQHAIQAQEEINNNMRQNIGQRFAKWGLRTERLEIINITPVGGVAFEMKRQMIAERQRRSDFIRAEGTKAAMRIKSEGDKENSLNMGVAEQEATRKQSEGVGGARIELARAERQSIDLVAEALKACGSNQTEYMLSKKFIELFRFVTAEAGEQKYYLPYEMSGKMSGIIGKLSSIFGVGVKPPVYDVKVALPVQDETKYDFDELN